ncbi:hypothetical protein [Phormidesmis priestleyi]
MRSRLIVGASSAIALLFSIACSALPVTAANSVGRIVEKQGEVALKRGKRSIRPVNKGAELYPGDLLKPARRAIIIVRCVKGNTWILSAGVESNVNNRCQTTKPSSVSLTTGDTRGGSDSNVPYVISPRKTLVLDGKPTIRWNAAPGAMSYTVIVRASGVTWKVAGVKGTQVTYGGEPLKAKANYSVVVKAEGCTSSKCSSEDDDSQAGTGFTLVTEAEAQQIRSNAQQLAKQDLSDEAKALTLADFYAEQELMNNAIQTLETLAKQGSKTVAVYQMLGEFYERVELSLLAKNHYGKALELAKAERDVAAQAAAKVGLARVFWGLGSKEFAIRNLKEAQSAYKSLEDAEQVKELTVLLAKWQEN